MFIESNFSPCSIGNGIKTSLATPAWTVFGFKALYGVCSSVYLITQQITKGHFVSKYTSYVEEWRYKPTWLDYATSSFRYHPVYSSSDLGVYKWSPVEPSVSNVGIITIQSPDVEWGYWNITTTTKSLSLPSISMLVFYCVEDSSFGELIIMQNCTSKSAGIFWYTAILWGITGQLNQVNWIICCHTFVHMCISNKSTHCPLHMAH